MYDDALYRLARIVPEKHYEKETRMVRPIDRIHVQQLLASGAQLVDVMSPAEYGRIHLQGAINLPLTRLNHQPAATLDQQRAVIVYCYDYQ